ncbi:hypothetical protein N7517_006145 [Penicillium concentricum]|uniref:Uncharacterized protein n=1 Tax=Penicillium concentricum TaxID=293559 RepID=A0A9W9VB23_9EURO|nr:uncharacterized protein N7517_006145 [Penicillium concentricum]KAJ5374139.1 hypothetical protein N7517_006145 [Penicillium concentricum]
MFSASALLCIGTWAAVVLQVTAVPHGPLYNKIARGNNDTCGPVGQYTENRSSKQWNQANTDAWLETWWTENAKTRTSNAGGFAGAFGYYALSQSDWSCQNNGNNDNCGVQVCNNPKINSLGDSTEQAYYVLKALNNLHGFYLGLEESFNIAAVVSALENDEIVNNFWHDENAWDPLVSKEIMNLIVTLVAVGTVGLSAPVLEPLVGTVAPSIAGASSTLLSGGVSAAILATTSLDTTDITQANLGHLMAEAVRNIADSFVTSNNELMFGNGYGNGDIRDVLKGGAWVNYPGLQKNQARNSMIATMQAMMINSLWRSQRVFIIGGGACHDGQDVGRGTSDGDNVICDEENRAWYLYYWQKDITKMNEWDRPNGWISRPWGSDRMGESPILQGSGPFWNNLSPLDAIKSSLKSFKAAGNKYDTATFNKRMAEIVGSGANPYSEGASMEGVWTIPVCDISKTVNNPDYIYARKGDILHPYGYDERPYWCGPICGMDKNMTAEFYKAANFNGDFDRPFLADCAVAKQGTDNNGLWWDWTTNEDHVKSPWG